jgi:hypothetical protein
MPSILGIIQSSIASAGAPVSCNALQASAPSAVWRTSCPCCSNTRDSIIREASSSSAISIRIKSTSGRRRTVHVQRTRGSQQYTHNEHTTGDAPICLISPSEFGGTRSKGPHLWVRFSEGRAGIDDQRPRRTRTPRPANWQASNVSNPNAHRVGGIHSAVGGMIASGLGELVEFHSNQRSLDQATNTALD